MANPVLLFQDIDSGETGPGALDVRGSRSAAGIITFDNKNDVTPAPTFVIDTINRRLGHATSGTAFVPLFDYHFQKEAGNCDYVYDTYSNNGGENFEFQGRRARGTIAAPTALADDDDMWEFGCYGHDGVAFSGQQAAILFEAAGAWTGTSHGSRQVYKTTENGTLTLSEVLVLGDDGCVVVSGQTNGLIGAVAGEYLRVVGATRGQGTIGTFANSTDTQPQSQMVDGSIIMGVGGVTTPDVRWRRISAALSAFDNNTATRAVVIDATNGRIGVSSLGEDTFVPLWGLHVVGDANEEASLFCDGYGTGSFGQMQFRSARGTFALPTALQNGDSIGVWGVRGYGATAFSGSSRASMRMLATENWTDAAQGAQIIFTTTPNTTAAAVTRYTIEQNGNLIMNGNLSVLPTTDSNGLFGTSALRFSDMVSNLFRVFAAASDANPTAQLSTGAVILGAGGGTALDTRMRWSAAATITFDNNSTGGITLVPATTNTGQIGTNGLKWNRIRATSVVTGDLEMCDEERNAHWVFREETDRIVVTNKINGKKYTLALKEFEDHGA